MKPTVTHNTILLERKLNHAPEKVFAAFSNAKAKQAWFADTRGSSMNLDSFKSDFKVGGLEQSRFRFKAGSPLPEGTQAANDTVFMDIVSNKRIILAYTMSINESRISSSLVTFEFLADGKGTLLKFTDQIAFYEGADGVEMRTQGWTSLLEKLEQYLG